MKIDTHNVIFGILVGLMLVSSVTGAGIVLFCLSVFVLFRFGAVLSVACTYALYILIYATSSLPYILLIFVAGVSILSLWMRRYTIFVQ